ncbi:MAG: methionine--tRNA ligase [Thermodesulfovibrionales bacterium]|nr:methionine--tRNA ligase [Thermodesulfovibrionales bacterium]
MKFYVTTPIYYVNDLPHIGHAYTSLAADVLARYYRMRGNHVMFLTGTDEHGQKVADAAAKRNLTSKEHADSMMENFHDLTLKLNLTNDGFIRTTDDEHKRIVQELMQRLWDKGEVERRSYSGWYCTPCERFWTEKDLQEGNCPECSRPVEQIEEDNYFFLMSKYAERLEQHIVDNPEFILPESRRNEVLGFLRSQPLQDLCISRPVKRLDWGVPLPFDKDYVTYVWFDALINYYSGAQYLAPEIFRLVARNLDENEDGGESLQLEGARNPSDVHGESHQLKGARGPWPADVHLIGKDILTTHAVYWITMLMALELPLPGMIFAHGWWTIAGAKMSKSLGNVVDPSKVVDKYGNDAFRFFLFREVPFGLDGDFSEEALVGRINTDLANDFGNLASRTLKMAENYFEGKVPSPGMALTDAEHDLKAVAEGLPHKVEDKLRVLKFQKAIEDIWRLLTRANKYLDDQAPWKLAKDPEQAERLATVMYNTLEALRILALHLHPIMPDATQKLWQALGLEGDLDTLDLFTNAVWGGLKPGTELNKLDNLFPRIDTKKKKDKKIKQEKKKVQPNNLDNIEKKKDDGLINIKDFAKVELKTAKVLEAERVEGSEKLIKLQVDSGEAGQPEQTRQIVAGIGKAYTPEELVGKIVVVVANLKPAKLMGVESQGMLLAATGDDGEPVILSPEKETAPGLRIK